MTTLVSTWPARAQDAAAAAQDPAGRQADYRAISEKLDRLYAGVEVLEGAADETRFDIDALAQKIGPNPDRMLTFVQREIAYEPYVGKLRGPRGALAGGAANALDRSLLLAALLERSGFTVEIARGRLGDERAIVLLQRVGQPTPDRAEPLQVDAGLLRSLIDATGIDIDALLAGVKDVEEQVRAVDAELMNRAAEDEAFLASRLEKAGIVMAPPATVQSLAPIVADHFWVRYRAASGEWVELDPSFEGLPAGRAAASLDTAFAPAEVPGELNHQLTIRMMLRTTKDGAEEDHTLIERRLNVADLYGRRLTLANLPVPSPFEAVLAGKPIDAALSEVTEIAALLIVGNTPTVGRFLNAGGDLFDNPPGTDTGRAERLRALGEAGLETPTGTLETLFDDPTTRAPEGSEPGRRIVAQWVEYAFHSPTLRGTPATRRETRTIYPMRGYIDRADGEILRHMIWSADLMPIAGPMNVHEFGHLQYQAILARHDSALANLRQAMQLPVDFDAVALPGELSLQLAMFVTALTERLALIVPQQFPHLSLVWNRPQLIAFETKIVARPGQPAVIAEGYDIIALAPNVILHEKPGDAAAIAVRIGALANALEWSLMRHRFDSGVEGASPPTSNTGTLMRAAIEQNAEIVTLKPQDDRAAALARLQPPPGERARIGEALDDGHVVIAPAAPVTVAGGVEPWFGWWQVDLQSGEIIGVMDGGRGTGEVEYAGLKTSIALGVAATLGCMAIPAAGGSSVGAGVYLPCIVLGVATGAGAYGAIGAVPAASIGILAGLVAGLPTIVSWLTTPAPARPTAPAPTPTSTPSAPNPGSLPAPGPGRDVMVPGE